MSEQEIEVLDPAKQIAAYNPIKAGIAALAEKYGNTVFSVATTKDMDTTKAARAEVREVRYNVEAVRKELKAPALAYSKRIDAEAAEYTAALLAIETPIDEIIKAEEARKADEKAERERIEAEARAAIQADIDNIKNLVVQWAGKPSQVLQAAIDVCSDIEVTFDRFGERSGEAEIAKQQTLSRLREMHAAAVKHEAEQEQLAADRAELARQQEEQKQRDAEAKKKTDAEEAERKTAHEKRQADLKAQQDAIDQQKQELADAKAAAEKAEQVRLDAIEAEAQAKRDAEAKKEKDAADAEAAAAKRKADDEVAEAARRERVQFEQHGPGYDEIVTVIAAHYGVEISTVIHWLSLVPSTQDA